MPWDKINFPESWLLEKIEKSLNQTLYISRITQYAFGQLRISFNRSKCCSKNPRITNIGESSKNDYSFKGKEVIKPSIHSCSLIATMSTIDLKGLDNTFRIPKPVYTKNRSMREAKEK